MAAWYCDCVALDNENVVFPIYGITQCCGCVAAGRVRGCLTSWTRVRMQITTVRIAVRISERTRHRVTSDGDGVDVV